MRDNQLANVNMQDGTELMAQSPPQSQSIAAVQAHSTAVAQVQASYLMAMNRPRNEKSALVRIQQTCDRESLAEVSEYCFPRGEKMVRGPSIDLIRAVARHWGNISTGIEELSRQNGMSEVMAFAVDLETNFRDEKRFTVRHWRDTQQGGYQLKNERDIYEIIANMGARRQRACLEAVIPGDIVDEAVMACRRTLEKHPIQERIARMVAAFQRLGVDPPMIEARAGKYLREFTHNEVTEYIAIGRAIKGGEIRLQVIFPGAGVKSPASAEKANTGQNKAQGGKKKSKDSKPSTKSEKAQTHTQAPESQSKQEAPQESAQADNPAPAQAPQEGGDIWEEVKAGAVELWGDNAESQMMALCEQFGMNFANLTKKDVENLLDIINERLSMQG